MPVNLYEETLAQVAQAPGVVNPHVDTLQQQSDASETQLRVAQKAAVETTPDRAAEVRKLSASTGLPPDLVERNFDDIRKRAAVTDTPYTKLQQESPAFADWLKQPWNAAVARDDHQPLTDIERTLQIGKQILGAGTAAMRGMEAGTFGAIAAVARTADAIGQGSIAKGLPVFAAEMEARAAKSTQEADLARGDQSGMGLVEKSIFGGIEGAAQMAPAILAGMVLGPEATLGIIGATSGGQAYANAKQQGVSTNRALAYGGIDAAINVGTMYIPAERMLAGLAEHTPLVSKIASQIVGVPLMEVQTALTDLNRWALLEHNKGKTLNDYFRERPSAAASSAIAAITMLGLTTVAGHGAAHFIEKLGEHTEASKTVERAPEAVQDFVAQATKDGGADHLYAPIDTFTTYWQKKGLDPATIAAKLTGDPQAYARAVQTGEDLVIPTANYAAQIAPTEHNAFFTNELRLAPEQMNGREAAAFQKESSASAEKEPAIAENPAAPVRENIATQLEAAGFEKATADNYAKLYESAFQTIGDRAGIDPVELFKRYQLQVQSGDLTPITEGATVVASDGAVENANFGSGAGAAEAGAAAEPRDRSGPEGGRLSKRAQAERDSIDSLVQHAVQSGYAGDPQHLTTQLAERAQIVREINAEVDAAGGSPSALVRAIVKAGGLSIRNESANQGELRRLKESDLAKRWGFFTGKNGLPLDGMLEALQEDGRFQHLTSINDLLDELDSIASGEKTNAGEVDAKQLGATGDKWWELFQSGGLFDDHAPVDTLDTGEQQPRLPEAGPVRDQEIATPQFDAPFALTSEVAREKAKQDTLFQGRLAADRSHLNANDKLASITFGPDRKFTITLSPNADLSSFVHETGHLFLEVLRDLETESHAAKGELDKLRDWFEQETGSREIDVAQHELMARGFEAYLMEGKAPSADLRGVFAKMRAWMTGVYRSLRDLDVTLSPEVRGVFDRLLASDDAIASAEREGKVSPLFMDPATAGMTEKQFEGYRSLVQDASDHARDELQSRVLREVQREQQQWWTAARAEMRGTVEGEIHQQPVYQAQSGIRYGTYPDGTPLVEGQAEPMKLAKSALVDRYDADTLAALRRSQLYTVDGGLHPDAAAELFGFSSGDELVKALAAVPPMKQAIETETDARMQAKFGDILRDGKLFEEAQAAVFGEQRQAVVQAELKALTKGIAQGVIPPASLLRSMAEQRIGQTKVRDLRPGHFLMAAQRASAKAFDLVNSDRIAAVQAKQQELLNLALYREATTGKDFEQKAGDYLGAYLGKLTTRERIGKASPSALEQLDGLRDRFEFTRQTNKALDRRASLAQFIESEKALGHELAIPEDVQNEAFRQNYRDLTVSELRNVYDAAKSIEHWARFKNKLLRQQEKRELDALGADGSASIAANANGKRAVPVEPRLPGSENRRNFKGWVLGHRPLLAILREMDGFKDGFMFENVWRPAHESRNAEGIKGHAARVELETIADTRFHGRESSRYEQTYIPEAQTSLSTAARLAVALNNGNEGNRERLYAAGVGNTGPLSKPAVQAIINTLTADDWAYVKATAAHIGSYKTEIGALYKRVTGVEPTWVEPSPFMTPHGEMPGWYYPIAYEGRASARALPGSESSFADIVAQSSYMRFQTANGHTEARTEHTGMPLRADLGVIGEHVQQVIHDLTHREMLIDVGRVLGRKDIQDAIVQHYGDQYYREIRGAFRDVAIGPMPAPDWYRVIAPVRKGGMMARLAWNFATMTRHVTNLTSGMVRVGKADVLAAIPRMLGSARDAEDSAGWIAANSPLMASRWDHRMEELVNVNQDIGLNRGKWTAQLRDAAVKVGVDPDLAHRFSDSYLYGIHKIIQMAEMPTWDAAYRQARDAGRDHADAVASADNATLDAFGGGDTLDLAGVQRSHTGKLFTTFMTYALSLHRQNYEILHRDTTIARKVVDASLLNIVPVVLLGALFHAADPRKDDSLMWELASDFFSHATGMFVFSREVSSAFNRPEYNGPAALAPFGTASRAIFQSAQVLKADSLDDAATKAKKAGKTAAELTGQFYGVPVYQVEKTADGIQALWEGRTHNPTALLFGGPKK